MYNFYVIQENIVRMIFCYHHLNSLFFSFYNYFLESFEHILTVCAIDWLINRSRFIHAKIRIINIYLFK